MIQDLRLIWAGRVLGHKWFRKIKLFRYSFFHEPNLQPWTNSVAKTQEHEIITVISTEYVSAPPFPLSMLENGKMQTYVRSKCFKGEMCIEWVFPTLVAPHNNFFEKLVI